MAQHALRPPHSFSLEPTLASSNGAARHASAYVEIPDSNGRRLLRTPTRGYCCIMLHRPGQLVLREQASLAPSFRNARRLLLSVAAGLASERPTPYPYAASNVFLFPLKPDTRPAGADFDHGLSGSPLADPCRTGGATGRNQDRRFDGP